ncbi:hypothetical protein HID58_092640 [Brassica napus]|uniref:Aminotransferase class V domain-containing protein n=1 Tax=Brassica napus TaxID=3708 RepID=A0ABQ7XF96_BRANA|nr:hypothetical protein HID58_092640 [Brassica napus]
MKVYYFDFSACYSITRRKEVRKNGLYEWTRETPSVCTRTSEHTGQVVRAMNRNNEDYRSPAIPALTKTLLEDVKKIFKTTSGTPFMFPTTGTGAWESALTNTLSPGDRIVSFLIGQFSLLWIDQQKRLNFNVDVVESEWGQGANLQVLASKLSQDQNHTIKAICIVHNETATGVTNDISAVRTILGH